MPKPLPKNIETSPGQGAGRPGPPGAPGAGFSAGLDLTGTPNDQTVIGFRTRPLSAAVPNSGDAYVFNGTQWAPAPAGGGGGSVPALSSFLFVDSANVASGQDGSIGKPFATIQQALDIINVAGGTWGVFISPGFYDEVLSVAAGVQLALNSPGYGLVSINMLTQTDLTWEISSACSIILQNIAINSIVATDGAGSEPDFGLLQLENSTILGITTATFEFDIVASGPKSYIQSATITGALTADGVDHVRDVVASRVQIQSSALQGTISASSGSMTLTACQLDNTTSISMGGTAQSVYMDASTYYWFQNQQTSLTGSNIALNLMDSGTTTQVKLYNADSFGFTYNVVPSDAAKCISISSTGSPVTAIIPQGMPIESTISFFQSNTRSITIAGGAGVTVISAYGSTGLTTFTPGSIVQAYQIALNEWIISGDSVALHTPSPAKPTDHDTTFSPVGLWQFHETLVDTSGSGIDLAANSQTHYSDLYPGYFGWDGVDGQGLHTITVPTPAALRITGDITIEALIKMPANIRGTAGAGRLIISFDSNNGLSTGNRLYGFGVDTNGYPLWSQQSGTNANSNYTVANYFFPEGLFHLAVTRASNVIQFYVNGRPLGAASGTLTTPTGGSVSNFQFGFQGGAPLAVALASLKVIPSALNATQIKSEYNRTLGKVFGLA